MAFLTLNGWTIPVRDASASGSRAPHGSLNASWTNRPNAYRQGFNREWQVSTAKMDQPCADTLEALLDGRGYFFTCDDTLSSTNGLPPQGGVGTITFPSPGIDGEKYMHLSSGTIIWNPGFYDGKWTVMYWRNADLGRGLAEYIAVRSDGAKWVDGVRNDAATTTELSVASGAVTFSTGDYDGIVILPFAACTSFIEDVSVLMVRDKLVFYVPLDEPAGASVVTDIVARRTSSSVSGGTFESASMVGTGVDYPGTTASDKITFAASGDWSASANGAITVEGVVRLDSLASERRLVSTFDDPETRGWKVLLQTSGAGWKFAMNVKYATTSAESIANVEIPFGEAHHIACVWSTDDDTVKLYLDGVEVAYTSVQVGAGGVTSDASTTLTIANDESASNRNPDGTVDNIAIYASALSSASIAAAYSVASSGVRHSLYPSFSPMPRLTMSGSIIGGEEIDVSSMNDGSNVVEYGSDVGWVNNARELSFTLLEHKPIEHELVQLDVQYILSRDYVDTGVYPVSMPKVQATPGSGVVIGGVLGPYGYGEASSFDNTANGNIPLSATIAERLVGKSAVSVVAFVRRLAVTETDQILCLAYDASNAKFQAWITATDLFSIGAKVGSNPGIVLNAADTITDTNWHMVGGVADAANGVMEVYIDGELSASSTPTFQQDTFDGAVHTSGHYIGVIYNGTSNPFNGDIAMVGWAHRRLSAGDFRAIYNRAKRGWLR